jgi:hypothetical protein
MSSAFCQDNLHDEVEEMFEESQSNMVSETEAIDIGLSVRSYNLPKYDKPFINLPIKQRAMVVLKLAMFTDGEIARLLAVNPRTVAKYTLSIDKLRG